MIFNAAQGRVVLVEKIVYFTKNLSAYNFWSCDPLLQNLKNEQNAPNVQRFRHSKLASSRPWQNVTKCQKSF